MIVTDSGGASRVYGAGDVTFIGWDRQNSLQDKSGNSWTLTEQALTHGQQRLERLPAHRAFWFGWYAAYNDTKLIH